jgi:hypothetical protein
MGDFIIKAQMDEKAKEAKKAKRAEEAQKAEKAKDAEDFSRPSTLLKPIMPFKLLEPLNQLFMIYYAP